MSIRSVTVRLSAQTSAYQAAMARAAASTRALGITAQTSFNNVGTRLDKVGTVMSNVGSKLTTRVSLPLAAAGGMAIKTAVDFETAFTGVRKTIDATERQYRQLERGIQRMAERVPASVEEISKVAEAAGQLGIQRESILGFTRTMLDLGETTNLTSDEAATALARLANITKMPQDQFDRLGATIVDLGNKGASTEAEITQMALRIAGAGAQIGLQEHQILAFAEALSSVGIRAEAGGSAISRVFIDIANAVAKGGQDLEAFARVAGSSSADYRTAFEKDAAGATLAFIEGLGRIRKEGGNVFKVLEDLGLSEIRVRDALLRASGAGDLFRKSLKNGAEAWKENSALTEEARKRYKTTAAQLEILRNQARNIAAQFGKDLIPVLRDVADVLGDALKGFRSLDPEMRQNIIRWAALAAVLGPIVKLLSLVVRLSNAGVGAVGKIGGLLGGGAKVAGAGGAIAGAAAGASEFGTFGRLSVGSVAGAVPKATGLSGARMLTGGLTGAKFPKLGLLGAAIAAGFQYIEAGAAIEVDKQARETLKEFIARVGVRGALRTGRVQAAQGRVFGPGATSLGGGLREANEIGTIEALNKAHREYVQRITGSTRATDDYLAITKDADALGQRQQRTLADLVSRYHENVGAIDDLTRKQTANLLKQGAVGEALKLLNDRYRENKRRMDAAREAQDGWAHVSEKHKRASERSARGVADLNAKIRGLNAASRASEQSMHGWEQGARQAGDEADTSRRKTRELSDALSDVPNRVSSHVNVETGQAHAKVAALTASLNAIRTVTSFVSVQTVGGGGGALRAMQHGGPVRAGHPYLVGERGAELFVPSHSGQIIPHSRTILGGDYDSMKRAFVQALRESGNIAPMEVRDNLFLGVDDFERRTEQARRRRQALMRATG